MPRFPRPSLPSRRLPRLSRHRARGAIPRPVGRRPAPTRREADEIARRAAEQADAYLATRRERLRAARRPAR